MTYFDEKSTVSKSLENQVFRLPSKHAVGESQVNFGGLSPAFHNVAIEDKGKVRLGGFGPIFR